MTDSQDNLSEAEARRLWQKAAQLQAEAARVAEAKAAHEAGSELDTPRREMDGYALVHVRAAAMEAGISEEFVDAALADVRAEQALKGEGEGKKYRLSRLVLGNSPDTVESRRTVRATPAQVLTAMEELVPHEPYMLTLRERIGDPLEGGTLVFDINGVGIVSAGKPGFKGDASYADFRRVYVTVLGLPGSPPQCDLIIRSPVAWALRLNAGGSALAAGMGGAIGIGLGVAVVGILGLAGPVAGVVVAATSGMTGIGSLGGLRAAYRYGLSRGEKALDSLLAAVAARAEGGWGIAPPQE